MSYQIQQYSEPIFTDILWSRPEQKSLAGKLLIVGGNSHAIAAPSEAYTIAIQQGIGEIKVALPDKTKKLLGPKVPIDIELLPSNPSGSFSLQAQEDLYSYMSWADATLLAGDFGKNSETAILLESIARNNSGLQIYTRDAVDYFVNSPTSIINRDNMLMVLSLTQLQKCCINLKWATPITYNMGLENLCTMLNDLTYEYKTSFVIKYNTNIICAVNGDVIVTKIPNEPIAWRLKTASTCAVWWLQNTNNKLKSICTAITQIPLND